MACTVVGLALLVGRAREVAFGVGTNAPSEAAQKRSSLIHALTPIALPLLGAVSTMGGGSLTAIATAFVVFHMLGPSPAGTLQAALKADRSVMLCAVGGLHTQQCLVCACMEPST